MHKKFSMLSVMLLFLILTSCLALTSASAEDVIDNIAITVPSACSFTSSTQDATFTRTLNNNHYESGIGTNTFTVACNDIAGFSIYAIGYSNEEYGNTNMLPSVSGLPSIPTGTATSGNSSAWAMRLTPVTGTYAPTITSDTEGSFSNYHTVPSTYAKVATFTQIVDGSVGSSMTSDYAVFISSTQPAGTYTGKVKYTLVHPNDAAAPTIPRKTLYEEVASRSKGTQTAADLKAEITKPTSSNPSTDTSNSGVYEYNASVFGAASDAANTSKIYYYRGILDDNISGYIGDNSYGSNGDGTLYPNYVRLGTSNTATCWRIIRTTGSGGVKLLYNGAWNTTTNSCANAADGAQIRSTAAITVGDTSTFTSAFNGTSSTYHRIALVGYTYNPTYGDADVSTSTSVDTVFGSNSSYSGNSSNSTIKSNIETWYNNNLDSYTSILEPSAGYCSDRTAYSDTTTSTTLATIAPYATSGARMYFGAQGRNLTGANAGKILSLTCPSSRNVVDLYTTSNATNGNKQLAKPVALLTADELSFAGSGKSTTNASSAYNASSFARSGSSFWLLSPYRRDLNGGTVGFSLGINGDLTNGTISNAAGVRPSISLTSGVTPASGSGTAVDPWVINPPSP